MRAIKFVCVPVLSLVLAACGGDGNPGGNGSGGAGGAGGSAGAPAACAPNPALLSDTTECLSDQDCPCGSGCNLGLCEAQCGEDNTCAEGLRCDNFGRCRDQDDQRMATLVVDAAKGKLEALEPVLYATDTGVVYDVHFTAPSNGVEQMRFVADPGLEVSCDLGDTFGAHCLMPGPAAGATSAVKLRLSSALEPGELLELRAYGGGGLTTTVVKAPEAQVSTKSLGDAPSGFNLAGRYIGTAQLVASGVSADPSALLPVTGGLSVPVTASVFDGEDGVLVLADPARVLVDSDSWSAKLALGEVNADGLLEASLEFSRQHALSGFAGGGSPVELYTDALPAEALVSSGASPVLSFELTTRSRGAIEGAALPMERWRVRLVATGEPTLGADFKAPMDVPLEVAQSNAALGWEAQVDAALDAAAPVGSDALLPGLNYAAPHLQSCRLTDAAVTTATSQAVEGFWGSVFPADPLAPGAWQQPNLIPCGATFGAGCGTTSGSNRCADAAALYGCDHEVLPNALALGTTNGSCSSISVTDVCRVRARADGCAEGALCWEAGGSMESVGLGTQVLPASGELRCSSGARAAGIEMDLDLEELVPLTTEQLRTTCAADLSRLQGSVSGQTLSELFTSDGCLDPVRFGYALLRSGDGARSGAAVEDRVAALNQRLLQRWVELHGMLARKATQGEAMAQVERSLAGAQISSAAGWLDTSLAGWDLVLHPRVLNAFWKLPDRALLRSDYRPFVGASSTSFANHQEAGNPLPITLLETLQAQLELAQLVVKRAQYTGELGDLAKAQRTLRYAAVVRGLALQLRERVKVQLVVEGRPTPGWLARLDAAVDAVSLSSASLLGRIGLAQRGSNPLGIEDSDLPIYFPGDFPWFGGRFSAVSDYLLGSGPGSAAWAPTLIAEADEALQAARDGYRAEQDRNLAIAKTANDYGVVLADYGAEIRGLCGLPEGLTDSDAVAGWEGFSSGACYVAERQECFPDTELSQNDFRYQLCVGEEIRKLYGEGSTLDVEQCSFQSIPNDGGDCGTGVYADKYIKVTQVTCPGPYTKIYCGVDLTDGDHDTLPLKQLELLKSDCRSRFPSATGNPKKVEAPANCFRGSIGESALAIRATATEIQIAKSELNDASQYYLKQLESCEILKSGNNEILTENLTYARQRKHLLRLKANLENVATTAAAVKDCASAISGMNLASGVACGAAFTEAAFTIGANEVGNDIDNLDVDHDKLVQSLEFGIAEKQCVNEAEQYLVDIDTIALRVKKTVQELSVAATQFDNLKRDAATVYGEGKATKEALENRQLWPAHQDRWVDASVTTFQRKFSLAQRTTYLAVRAVEYEYQSSLMARSAVLAADTPAELEAVVDQLHTTSGTRRINGNPPTDLKGIVSLRDHLLQLDDRSATDPGWQLLSPVERLRLILTDPNYAVYSANGSYQGQQIPFHLAPLEALGLGDASGVTLFSQNDCAERLWSVSASVQGNELLEGSESTFVRIDLLKRNTFMSQWCGGSSSESGFQTASVRPSRNLFRDPTYGSDVGDQFVGEASMFSRARIEAYLNVSRAELEADEYEAGATQELAARGLFGDYALFIPAEAISTKSGEAGLKLDRIDDILLRLDYMSVAR